MAAGKDQMSHRSDSVKQDLVSRLNKIEGQIRGIRNLILKDTYCDDVIHQIASVQAAIGGLNGILVENHLKSCVAQKLKAGDPHIVNEFIKTIKKISR